MKCETCKQEPDGPIESWGHLWCPHCAQITIGKDGDVSVNFPSVGKLIPSTILTSDTKQHGGKRPGAGPKSKYTAPMVRLNARIPPSVKAQLIAEFGSVQKAVNALIIEPRLPAMEASE